MTTKSDIERVLWNACDSFRGKIDSSRYKDYILSMLFVKYLSDAHKEKKEHYFKQYDGDERRVERAMSREPFTLDEESTFDYLYSQRNDAEIGQTINIALNSIENHNSGKLKDVFRAIDFNSSVDFGEPKQKNAILKNLLEDFNNIDLRPSKLDSTDIIGDAYEYMIANFASDAGKKGGEFFTPSTVSELVAKLVEPKENDRIYDPTCGSGGLLLKAFREVDSKKVAIYGQEQNSQTWALCKMNMFLHGIDDAHIYQGDTLANPKTIENDKLMQFQVVVANPPFSLSKWDSGFLSNVANENDKKKEKMKAELDPYKRFDWGVPPSSKGDYAFAIIKRDENTLLGNASIMDVNPVCRTGTLGIFIGEQKERNKGYGAEALKLLLDYGFNILNLNNINLAVFSFNKNAIACYKKIGFKEYGVRHECYFLNGKYYDEILMEILRKDY